MISKRVCRYSTDFVEELNFLSRENIKVHLYKCIDLATLNFVKTGVILKTFLLFLMISSLVSGRDNPFEPFLLPKESSHNSNQEAKDYFEAFDFKLPTTARVLKDITVTYQNIDGSIETKTLHIDQSIDWHYPLRLTQQNALVSEETQYYSALPFEFIIKKNKLYIHSSYKMQRNFVLPKPYRIVIDVDKPLKNSSNLRNIIEINKKYFTKISIGTHERFYRVVITLDGQYQYDFTAGDGNYIVSLR